MQLGEFIKKLQEIQEDHGPDIMVDLETEGIFTHPVGGVRVWKPLIYEGNPYVIISKEDSVWQ